MKLHREMVAEDCEKRIRKSFVKKQKNLLTNFKTRDIINELRLRKTKQQADRKKQERQQPSTGESPDSTLTNEQ